MEDTLRFEATKEDDGERLDRVIARRLAAVLARDVSTREARRLVETGHVAMDGRPERRPSTRARRGARISVERARDALDAARERRAARVDLDHARVLFEDAHLVAIDKPARLPTHATRDEARDHLLAATARLLARDAPDTQDATHGTHATHATHATPATDGAHAQRPPELFAVHRLDAETSGVVLLAKDRATAEKLGAAFERREVDKVYVAVVAIHDGDTAATLPDDLVVRDHLDVRRGRAVRVRSGGRPAETSFHLVARPDPHTAVVEARPKTGRMHQIRVHLADRGAPILGDHLYADAATAARAPRLLLHARRLALAHPETGTPLVVEAPLPGELARYVR